MSQHTAGEPDPTDVRSALATLLVDEPALPSGMDDVERRGRRLQGRRLLARRSLGAGVAAAVVTVAAVSLGPVAINSAGPAPTNHIAALPAAPADGGGAAGGTQLAVGFTVDMALRAVGTSLPATVGVGELPMDIGWRAGGTLGLPLASASGTGVLTIRITGGSCTATVAPAGVLSAGDLGAVTSAVCAAWVAEGSPAIVPAGAPGAEQPGLANQ